MGCSGGGAAEGGGKGGSGGACESPDACAFLGVALAEDAGLPASGVSDTGGMAGVTGRD